MRRCVLDLATQQLVVIARALSKKVKLLILDEPTAALTEREASRNFDRVRSLKARGGATIFVSHQSGEVFSIADRIVVMRDGRINGDHAAGGVSRTNVVAEMVGEMNDDKPRRSRPNPRGACGSAVDGKSQQPHDPHERANLLSE